MADQAQAEQPNMSRRERPATFRPRGPRAPRSDAPRNGASSDAPRDVETEPNVLFVAGFPIDCEARTVGLIFEKFGPVRHVRLSRGVGRVVFEDNEAAQKGLSLNGTDYEGRKLRIELHHKRQRRAQGSRAPRAETSPRAEGASAPRGQRPRKPRNAPSAAEPAEQQPVDPTRVFVGKLAPETEDSAVQAIFSKFGAIANYERARSRRFALIQFGSADEASKAVESGASLDETPLRVEIVNPNSRKAARSPRVEAAPSGASRRPRRAEPVRDDKRLYFGYLPENTQSDAITSAYSGVSNVELRGKFAYVTFDDDASAQAALNNPKKLGENVRVEVAERGPRTRRPRGPANGAASETAAASAEQ